MDLSLSGERTSAGSAPVIPPPSGPASDPALSISGDRTRADASPRSDSSATPSAALHPGLRVGRDARYELLSKLGEGGMGAVWKARDTQLGREVAIKRILGHASPMLRERFQRETQAVTGLRHPNIVTVFDAGEDAFGLYLVMEFVPGQTLAAQLHKGPIPLATAIATMQGLCRGAAHAHKKGVVHRDIKPGNVMVDDDGVPRLLDFGLVRLDGASELSMTGVGMGTLDYAAPEQKRDASKADARSDVYALGLVFYELLTGLRPPVSLKRVPESWRTLVERATDPMPEDRHANAEELLVEVEAAQAQASSESVVNQLLGTEDDLRCPKCKLLNTLEAKFCRACSTSLRADCPACGMSVRVGLKRCDQCAAEVLVVVRLREGLAVAAAEIAQARLDEAGARLTALAPLASSGQLGGANQLQDEWRGRQSAHAAAVAERAKLLDQIDAVVSAMQQSLAAGDRTVLPRLRSLQVQLGDDARLAPLSSAAQAVAVRWLQTSLSDLPDRLQRLEPAAVAELRALEAWFVNDACLAALRAAQAAGQAAFAQRAERLRRDGFAPVPGASIDAATGLPQQIVHERTGAVLVLIPAGEFVMGSPASESGRRSDETQHRRVIRKSFYLGKTALTQAQWRKVMGGNPSHFIGDDLPVERVSWEDCQQFLHKAGGGLRLPSEAEWEYACRAGTMTAFSFGVTITPSQVNYNGKYPYGGTSKGPSRQRTVAAGSLPANAWGLHEMHGNVWEWCQDAYAPYPAEGTDEPAALQRKWWHMTLSSLRVLRGGSWLYYARDCRAAIRHWSEPSYRDVNFGLRIARTLSE